MSFSKNVMTKTTLILVVASLVILIIGIIYYQGKEQGANSQIVIQQQEQIKIHNETIKTKEFQQKIINKTSANDNNDSRKQWMHFLWQKRNEAN